MKNNIHDFLLHPANLWSGKTVKFTSEKHAFKLISTGQEDIENINYISTFNSILKRRFWPILNIRIKLLRVKLGVYIVDSWVEKAIIEINLP